VYKNPFCEDRRSTHQETIFVGRRHSHTSTLRGRGAQRTITPVLWGTHFVFTFLVFYSLFRSKQPLGYRGTQPLGYMPRAGVLTFRNVCFTVNNPTVSKEDYVDIMEKHPKFRYAVLGDEVSSEGTPHFQGYLELTDKIYARPLQALLPGAFHEERIGTALEAADYCKKEGEWVERGTMTNPGRRTDIEDIKRMVKEKRPMSEIAEHTQSYQQLKFAKLYKECTQKKRPIQDIDVRWYYGKAGTGKTKAAYDEFPDLYTPINHKWWEDYQGETVVLIDDFRKDWCKFHELIKLLDRYPIKVECKGSFYQLQATTIILTAPVRPEDMYDTREDLYQLTRRITTVKHFPEDLCPGDELVNNFDLINLE